LGGFCIGCNFFGIKIRPPTYQKAITKAFHEYIDVFMNILLDDFIVFSDLSTHLEKLIKCFLKYGEYGVNLNLKKMCIHGLFWNYIRIHSLQRGEDTSS